MLGKWADFQGLPSCPNTKPGDWKENTFTWGQLLTAEWSPFSNHPQAKGKQGASVVLGQTIGGNRNAESVKNLSAIVIDVDSGPTYEEVRDKLIQKGVFASMYTSFYHKKTRVELKHDEVVRKLKLDDTPTLPQIIEYLRLHHKNGAGVFYVMNSTPNAIEDIATTCSGTFMALDEIGAMQNPASLGSTLFGLSSATGKNRKKGRGAGLAETAEFRTFSVTTNERSLKTTRLEP